MQIFYTILVLEASKNWKLGLHLFFNGQKF